MRISEWLFSLILLDASESVVDVVRQKSWEEINEFVTRHQIMKHEHAVVWQGLNYSS